jgi:predicted nucleotidyltransferase
MLREMQEDFDLDALKLQWDLNREVWDEEDRLHPEIAERLLMVAEDFIKKLKIDGLTIHDIVLTGSLANYNWSKYSDFDLHIVLDFKQVDENETLVKKFFDARRLNWNKAHQIFLKDYEVEIYVENRGEAHESTGIYSVKYDRWIVKPRRGEQRIDRDNTKKKAQSIKLQIDDVERLHKKGKHEETIKRAEEVKQKIMKMRRSGLESGGVYSVENLAFKLLRRAGEIGKLMKLGVESYDSKMSLDD